jgi:hypothetical protein
MTRHASRIMGGGVGVIDFAALSKQTTGESCRQAGRQRCLEPSARSFAHDIQCANRGDFLRFTVECKAAGPPSSVVNCLYTKRTTTRRAWLDGGNENKVRKAV